MSSAAQLKTLWQGWSNRFAALQAREKPLIIGALVVAILFGGFTLFVEPGMTQSGRLNKTLVQQQAEQEQFQAQIAALAAQSSDPDSANRTALQQVRDQLAVMEGDLRAFDRILVAPRQAPALLQTLLARHRGLSLVSLTTLSPQPLIEPPAAPAGKPASDGAKPAGEASMPGGNIYKHGIEIKLAGGYSDLLAYVADLEASPQKLLWGGMRLTVTHFPVSELTLTVYTLSLDSIWLVV
jgi:MSHA biogenesis protein MshJ